MEGHGSQRITRLKRKALSDLTNTTQSSSSLFPSSSPLKPTSKPNPRHKSTNSSETILRSDTAVGEKNAPDGGVATTSTPRVRVASRESVLSESQIDKSILSTSTRENTFRRKCTRKAVLLGASSCPPIGRGTSPEENRKVGEDKFDRPVASSVPYGKATKRQRSRMTETLSKPLLPQDFVEKQRAYFAEIDTFELPEEVISESELD